ncbi:MAG TPA: protein-glutamate O-methyltransferase CheR [Bryobacteraceae bacterium]|nr:protein-glutamate O-methyltransferase CheR [Bryobacteraceae bacterium]
MPRFDQPLSVAFEDPVRPLADSEFEEIRELARRTFGLDLRPGKQELVSARLQRLVRGGGFRSYREYYRHVLSDRSGEALMALIDALATNHTSFLREADHFDFLREKVLPNIARRSSIDIWSAACSTGEEVWTLLLILQETLPASRFLVIGSDISRKALRLAARGVYPANRIATLPRKWQESGFQRESDDPPAYQVKPALRERAQFRRLNLIEPISWPVRFPVIFCRNVMIYFDQNTQRKVIANLTANLEPGGYLFVGHSESFSGVQHGLEYVRPAVYRKPQEKGGGAWSGTS